MAVHPERLATLAWRWYRIGADVAEDLAQSAYGAFFEVQDRYPRAEEHPRILVGIFRNKCRAYIHDQMREARNLGKLKQALECGEARAARTPTRATADGGVLQSLLSKEDVQLILRSLMEARAPAREVFRLILQESATREDLVRRLHINKNTLDSRLHRYRKELRDTLARCGVLA